MDHETDEELGVIVTATDPSDGSATVPVTVTVEDVNEAPTITAGMTQIIIDENTDVESIIGNGYAANDLDADDTAATLVWSLRGTDASDFYIGNKEGETPGELKFREEPDYENPKASNNMYQVTVRVTDKGGLTATRDVVVTVADVEEPGTVTLSSVQPKIGVPLTASVKDPRRRREGHHLAVGQER